LSKIGVQLVPALVDLNTPPDALPTTTCEKSFSSASIAEMRPIRLALPMLRHFNEATIGSVENDAGACA
jgi:hypothetical protein